jgi:signal transduction histidine kinase
MLADILARESLQHRSEQLRDERDLYRSLLYMHSASLRQLAGDASTVTTRLRSLMQQRARTGDLFREKITSLRREAELIRSSALGSRLPSVARRAEMLQEALRHLEERTTSSGDDLLPIIAGLERLLMQLAVAYEYVTVERGLTPEREAASNMDPDDSAIASSSIAGALRQLVERLAAEHRHDVGLTMLGLEAVPEEWTTAIFDILSQLARNAVEHGIEPADVRRRRGKPAKGTVLIEFRPRADGGHELKFHDDGGGVDTDAVRAAAIARSIVDSQKLEGTSHQRLASLILLPGVTTAQDAEGRGQGLKIVRDQVKHLGGHIKVASKRDRFLRFQIDFDPKD